MTPEENRREMAQLEADIAARQKQIDKAATLAWAHERDEAAKGTSNVRIPDTKSAQRKAQAMNDTAGWQTYIAREIDRANKSWLEAAMSAVGIKLAELRDSQKQMREELRAEYKAELERQIAALRNEFLADRLDEARGVKRLKVVPPDPPGSMIA